jgi:hypothetical protein
MNARDEFVETLARMITKGAIEMNDFYNAHFDIYTQEYIPLLDWGADSGNCTVPGCPNPSVHNVTGEVDDLAYCYCAKHKAQRITGALTFEQL